MNNSVNIISVLMTLLILHHVFSFILKGSLNKLQVPIGESMILDSEKKILAMYFLNEQSHALRQILL